MTDNGQAPTSSDVVAQRVKACRQRRGWTADQLARRCAELGAPDITTAVLANIESGRPSRAGRRRRHVTVDELLALALALDVAPINLLTPIEHGVVRLTSKRPVNVFQLRPWIRGEQPLRETDRRIYYSEVPADEWRDPDGAR